MALLCFFFLVENVQRNVVNSAVICILTSKTIDIKEALKLFSELLKTSYITIVICLDFHMFNTTDILFNHL